MMMLGGSMIEFASGSEGSGDDIIDDVKVMSRVMSAPYGHVGACESLGKWAGCKTSRVDPFKMRGSSK